MSPRSSSRSHLKKIRTNESEFFHFGKPAEGISPGMRNVMRYYSDYRSKFAYSYSEYLDRFLDTYDNVSLEFGVTPLKKRRAMVFIVKENDSYFFNCKGRSCQTHEQPESLLRRRYGSGYKRARILCKWKGFRLINVMERNPEESQMYVCNDVIEELSKLHKKLDVNYHVDTYLRD